MLTGEFGVCTKTSVQSRMTLDLLDFPLNEHGMVVCTASLNDELLKTATEQKKVYP